MCLRVLSWESYECENWNLLELLMQITRRFFYNTFTAFISVNCIGVFNCVPPYKMHRP